MRTFRVHGWHRGRISGTSVLQSLPSRQQHQAVTPTLYAFLQGLSVASFASRLSSHIHYTRVWLVRSFWCTRALQVFVNKVVEEDILPAREHNYRVYKTIPLWIIFTKTERGRVHRFLESTETLRKGRYSNMRGRWVLMVYLLAVLSFVLLYKVRNTLQAWWKDEWATF